MVAIFKVQKEKGSVARIMVVSNVAQSDIRKIQARLLAAHVETAVLVAEEEYLLEYTANEIENEKNLLGGSRRYSTGGHTVTIPEDK